MPFHCLRCKAEIDSAYRACPHCGDQITDFTRRYTSDLIDGKYRVIERLGAGGMGQVFKAEHTFLNATRVIKVVHPQISENTDAKDRFLREARAATRIQHTNVAALHDFASLPDGSHYMVSEYIEGENLAQRLRTRGSLPPRLAVQIVIQALHGLHAIHRAGIVHRDISPENLMITAEDTVKIIDLGVAKVEDPAETAATRTGIFVGKLRYASPEQLGFLPEGEKIDGRADLYAMGMVLYELLTGRPPYEAKSPHEYFMLHARQPEAQRVELPPELPGAAPLQDVLNRALAHDRNQRFASAREFASALEEIERTLPDPKVMPTMAIPLDADETMRVKSGVIGTQADTLHRETLRTDAPPFPAPPAAAQPAAQPPAAPTLLTPLPAGAQKLPPVTPPAAPSTRMKQGISPVVVIIFFLLLFGGAIAAAVLLWPRGGAVEMAQNTTTTAAPAPAPAKVAEASVNVVTSTSTPETTTTTQAPEVVATTTTSSPLLTETIAPPLPKPTVIKPAPAPPVVTTTTRRDEPEPVREREREREDPPPAPIPSNILTYTDGYDDGSNDEALMRLREQVRGVRQIEVHGGAMQDVLTSAIQEEMPHLSIVGSAPVEIRFQGKLEMSGRGRKTREAHATIYKNGRPIFRYELPNEVYRVGLPPAQAFVRVMSDAFEE